MSKYLASLVPEQIMSMVTRIKEATIDVGPQPVKYAKFSRLPWEAILRIAGAIVPDKVAEASVECLLLSTDIAFEIWLIKPNPQRAESGSSSFNP